MIVVWLTIISAGLVVPVIGFSVSVAYGTSETNRVLSSWIFNIVLASVCLVLLAGIIHVIISLRVRCPQCGFHFFKSPDGFEPKRFAAHPNCSTITGVTPWKYQIVRLLLTGKIRCVKCGTEVFSERNQQT